MDSHKLDYHEIVDGVFVGTNACCRTHFDDMLTAHGITYDLSVEGEMIDTPHGATAFVWIPVPDMHPPTPEQLAFGVRVLRDIVALRRKVYVHCKNGHGRAPTLVGAYLIQNGMSADEAMEALRSKRRSVHLQPEQEDALRRFELAAR